MEFTWIYSHGIVSKATLEKHSRFEIKFCNLFETEYTVLSSLKLWVSAFLTHKKVINEDNEKDWTWDGIRWSSI